jgi:hypothetical protein
MKQKIIFLALMNFLFFNIVFATPVTQTFLALSDIHFNPLASCNSTACPILAELEQAEPSQWQLILEQQGQKGYSPYGQDSNYVLLASALRKAARVYQHAAVKPRFILVAGDNLGHHLQQDFFSFAPNSSQQDYQHFVTKLYAFMTVQLRQAFPAALIIPVMGNNDSFNGDYYSNPHGQFYSMLTQPGQWLSLLRGQQNKASFARQFPAGGYYVVRPLHDAKLRIVVLNSVLFSAQAKGPSTASVAVAARQELAWLQQQLRAAKKHHAKVWLAMHIPFGMDAYGSAQAQKAVPFWFANASHNYNQQFLRLVQQYKNTIRLIITAHTHNDALRLAGNTVDTFVPSISAIHGNNPAFKLYRYQTKNQAYQLLNYRTYFLPLQAQQPTWQQEYNFYWAYGAYAGCTFAQAGCVQQVAKALGKDKAQDALALTYQNNYAARGEPAITQANWAYFRCAIVAAQPGQYQTCLAK